MDNDQIYFKDIAIDFLKENKLEPAIVFQRKMHMTFKAAKKNIQFFFKSTLLERKPLRNFIQMMKI